MTVCDPTAKASLPQPHLLASLRISAIPTCMRTLVYFDEQFFFPAVPAFVWPFVACAMLWTPARATTPFLTQPLFPNLPCANCMPCGLVWQVLIASIEGPSIFAISLPT